MRKVGMGVNPNGIDLAAENAFVATSQQQAAAFLPYITVAKGDNLTKIARKFGVGWKELASVNGLESPYTIRVGQKLRIPS